MQIILLEKVANLGVLGDVVKVKDGYARNFLIPTGRARRATEKAVAEFEARRAELEKAQAEKLAAAQALGEKLSGKTITVTQKAGVDGRLVRDPVQHGAGEDGVHRRIELEILAACHLEAQARVRRAGPRDHWLR